MPNLDKRTTNFHAKGPLGVGVDMEVSPGAANALAGTVVGALLVLGVLLAVGSMDEEKNDTD